MSFERAEQYLRERGFADRIRTFTVSSATVALAAEALGCEPARIAKSLAFQVGEDSILILAAGDAKIDNPKYKAFFGTKAKMLSPEEAERRIGHGVGGVCPFGIEPGVTVYLDLSLRRFDHVYPACGNAASAVLLTPDELERLSDSAGWIDVCKLPE